MENYLIENKKAYYAKSILQGVAVAGMVMIACNSPSFCRRLPRMTMDMIKRKLKHDKWAEEKREYYNAFYYLRKNGFLNCEYKKGQLFISLTKAGKKRMGKYNIDNLKIKKTRDWDNCWWLLIFDIANKHTVKREALRGKLKQLGFYMIQKSIWVYPYNHQKEVELLRIFFGLSDSELTIIKAVQIENDDKIKKHFKELKLI